jgi:integrase
VTSFRLKNVHVFVDRHGKVRRYFRMKGRPRLALPGRPGSAEFMAVYNAGVEGALSLPPSRYPSRTIGALWTDYCRSAGYTNLSQSTKNTYRLIMNSILAAHGHRTVVGLKREHARGIIENLSETPGTANLTHALLRRLISFSIEIGWRTDNPFLNLTKYKLGEHHSWSDIELGIFEERWPVGTRERLAYDLLLFTAQRASDVVTMKHVDIASGQIPVIQKKTGTNLTIPIHPDLDRSIRSIPKRGVFILTDAVGRPIQRQSLSRIIRIAVASAGLPSKCVAHGLRKAALRRLAERGASDKEIAAVSGHRSMREVQRYTAAADQSGLAHRAIKRIPHKQ